MQEESRVSQASVFSGSLALTVFQVTRYLVIMGLVIGLVWTLWGMRRFSKWKRTEPPATTG